MYHRLCQQPGSVLGGQLLDLHTVRHIDSEEPFGFSQAFRSFSSGHAVQCQCWARIFVQYNHVMFCPVHSAMFHQTKKPLSDFVHADCQSQPTFHCHHNTSLRMYLDEITPRFSSHSWTHCGLSWLLSVQNLDGPHNASTFLGG